MIVAEFGIGVDSRLIPTSSKMTQKYPRSPSLNYRPAIDPSAARTSFNRRCALSPRHTAARTIAITQTASVRPYQSLLSHLIDLPYLPARIIILRRLAGSVEIPEFSSRNRGRSAALSHQVLRPWRQTLCTALGERARQLIKPFVEICRNGHVVNRNHTRRFSRMLLKRAS